MNMTQLDNGGELKVELKSYTRTQHHAEKKLGHKTRRPILFHELLHRHPSKHSDTGKVGCRVAARTTMS